MHVLERLSDTTARHVPMDVDTDECMFCHEELPEVADEPVNLAFMAHLQAREPCQDAFDNWSENMETDFLGD